MGAGPNPVPLLGVRQCWGGGQAMLSYFGGSGWAAGESSQSVETEVGTSMACMVGSEEV